MFRLVRSSPCEVAPNNKRRRAPWREVAVAALGVCLWASAASADVLLFSPNINSNGQVFTSPNGGIGTAFADLTGSGVTKLSFTTTAPNQRVIITYTANCGIGSGIGFVEVNIL